ncbi:MAG TPA: antibiotic biosynthesis monooxygenase [Vicinamibacterales bacterium]|nr:antibiotic biosynthesis monooxygenase [Vicinamibacterales bacterium]
MRTSALLALILVVTVAPPAVGQDWVEYINREDGFRVDFPGQPNVQQTSWASEYGYTLPARVYSASRGRERYSITVVDYRGVEAQGVARANACPAGAEPCRGGQAGSVIGPGYWKQDVRGAVMYATFKLLQRDAKLTHLMWNWTDLVDGNLVQLTNNADRSRTFAAIHMHDNRLYILEGTVPDGYPEPGLFQQSMGFVDREGNGIRYQALYTAYTGLGESPMPNRAGGGRGAGGGPAGAGAAPAAAAPPAGQAAQATPPAPPDGPRTVVTYLEVAPASDKEAAALLVKYRDATRGDGGNTGADVFQQNGRPGHFVVVEQWRDDASWKAHRGLPHTTQFHEKLTPLRVGPYDERWHSGIAGGSGQAASAGSVLVVTHIDVTGQGAPKVRDMLRTLSDTSRKESGNVRFDALQGVRQNHFTVLEGWRDERAREAHVSSGHAKTFREGLYGFAVDGAPYDERLYRVLGP